MPEDSITDEELDLELRKRLRSLLEMSEWTTVEMDNTIASVLRAVKISRVGGKPKVFVAGSGK